MISFSQDNDESALKRFVEKHELAWPQVRIGMGSELAAAYGAKGWAPVYVLVGTDGKILLNKTMDWNKLKAAVANVLDTSKDKKPVVGVEGAKTERNK